MHLLLKRSMRSSPQHMHNYPSPHSVTATEWGFLCSECIHIALGRFFPPLHRIAALFQEHAPDTLLNAPCLLMCPSFDPLSPVNQKQPLEVRQPFSPLTNLWKQGFVFSFPEQFVYGGGGLWKIVLSRKEISNTFPVPTCNSGSCWR